MQNARWCYLIHNAFGFAAAVGLFVGNVVQPRMQGRSLNMDPIVLLLALAFWTVLWGLPGAFLSTPLTTVMMVVLAQFDGTRWIAVLLSADGDPGSVKARTAETSSSSGGGKIADPKRRTKSKDRGLSQ